MARKRWGVLAALAGFVLALVVGLVPGTTRTAWARQGYGLWVGGVEVTEDNKDDVLGDADEGATVRFTPADPADIDPQATLTLSGASITTGYAGLNNAGIAYRGDYALNIELEDANSIEVGDSYAGILSQNRADVAILGTGSLSVSGPKDAVQTYGNLKIAGGEVTAKGADKSFGINAMNGDVTITGGHLEASGMYGINAGYGDYDLTIQAGEMIASGTVRAIIGTVKNAVAGTGWSDVEGTADEEAIPVNPDEGSELTHKRVQFPEVYPLWVGGVRATPANSGDLAGNHWTFMPAADGANATLTLENYFDYNYDATSEHEGAGIYWAGDGPLDIVTGASNEVCGSAFGVWGKSSITFRGEGTLTTAAGGETERWETDQMGQGIHAGGDLTAEGSTNVTALGPECGVHADGSVLLKGDSMSATSDKTAIGGSDVTVESGRVEARCTGREAGGSAGIRATGRVAINAGEVDAGGGAVGIEARTGVTVGNNVESVRARGTDRAIASRSVKNLVPGAGWADVAALADRTLIAVSAEGQSLDFRRVEFPFVVVAHKVTAKAEPAEGGTAKADPAEAGKGEAVKLYAEPADGYEFVKWSVEGDGAEVDGATSPKATLTMGTADVTVTANFKKKDAPTPTPEPSVAKAAKPKTVAYVSKSEVAVSWKAAKGAKTYQLQWRKAGAKKWTTTTVKGKSKTVTGLKAGACYEFRVRGVNGKVRGKWSSASLRWLKGAAKAKAAAGKSTGSVKATWKADKAATGGFKVFVFAKRGGKVVKTKVVKAGATSATVKGLKSGKTYYVRVRPYRAQGGSTFSGAISGYRSVKAK